MAAHPLDSLFSAARDGDDVDIPSGWGQGRATFGGVVGGVLLSHALGRVALPEESVRAMTVNFVGPVEPGAAHVTTEVLRQGKSATQLESRLTQADDAGQPTVRAVSLITIGLARPSGLDVRGAAADSERPKAASLTSLPYIEGVTPQFIERLDMRLARGGGPFSGGSDGDMRGYMRFKEPTNDFTLAHLVALIDSWPPAPAQMLTKPAPLSTMTWTLDFLAPIAASSKDMWWYEVVTDAAHDGYGHTQARIFTEHGEPVAISRQTVAVFG